MTLVTVALGVPCRAFFVPSRCLRCVDSLFCVFVSCTLLYIRSASVVYNRTSLYESVVRRIFKQKKMARRKGPLTCNAYYPVIKSGICAPFRHVRLLQPSEQRVLAWVESLKRTLSKLTLRHIQVYPASKICRSFLPASCSQPICLQ
jgi:hypothetical protein